MQRRDFLKGVMGATAGAVIGLPKPAERKPAVPRQDPPFKSCDTDAYVIKQGDLLAYDRKTGFVRPMRNNEDQFIGIATSDSVGGKCFAQTSGCREFLVQVGSGVMIPL